MLRGSQCPLAAADDDDYNIASHGRSREQQLRMSDETQLFYCYCYYYDCCC